MPRENRISSRLDTLLESIFEVHPDPFSLYWEIAAELRPEQHAPARQKIRRSLQKKTSLSTDTALLAACVLHLTGYPAVRILDFLSRRVSTPVSIPQFELAVAAIFMGDPPVSQELLYDLTQYTYLEKRLLVQKGLEISAKLKDRLSPEVLLYLYLLSLRSDLSNENVQLIVLIMRDCFPDVEVPGRVGKENARQFGDIARAWKKAEEKSRSADQAAGGRGESSPGLEHASASAFLDKYYADADSDSTPANRESKTPPRTPEEKRRPAAPKRPSAPPPAPRPASRRSRPGSRVGQAVATGRARSGATKGPADPRPPEAGDPPAQGSRAPAGSAPTPRGQPARARLPFLGTPFLLAVLAVLAFSVPMAFQLSPRPAHQAAPPHAGSAPAAGPLPGGGNGRSSVSSVARTYVVRPGDSLWKIFHSLDPEARSGVSWGDFLSTARSVNDLDDPDLIRPGAVLSIEPRGR